MKRIFLKKFSSLVVLFLGVSLGALNANATAANAPSGYWSCIFWGSQNLSVPGPNGSSQYIVRPVGYTSQWFPQKDDAYEDAKDDCQRFSAGPCTFSGCRQKSR
jgi:hypothetical protein